MLIKSTRMTGILLVFGIFFTVSCSSLLSTSQSAEDYYNSNNYIQALETIDKEISDQPDNPQKKILKAKILKDYAMKGHKPGNRNQLYQDLRNTVNDIHFTTDQYKSVTDSLLNAAWTHEQSEGVRFLQQDESNNFDEHFGRVIAHFTNAITIIPDSLVTYNLKATTYYRHGDLTKAIATLESIDEDELSQMPDTREKLAYLYLEAGLINRSIEIYEDLTADYPQNEVYRQGLANAYILGEKHEESVVLLEALSKEFSTRAEYKEALATQRFYVLLDKASGLFSDSQFSENDAEYFTDSLRDIGSIYNDVENALPSSDERQERIVEFHLHAATLLEKIEINLGSDTETGKLAASEREHHLQSSIPFLRSLFESNADNVAYGRKLIRVYNELNMVNEADSLERQINF